MADWTNLGIRPPSYSCWQETERSSSTRGVHSLCVSCLPSTPRAQSWRSPSIEEGPRPTAGAGDCVRPAPLSRLPPPAPRTPFRRRCRRGFIVPTSVILWAIREKGRVDLSNIPSKGEPWRRKLSNECPGRADGIVTASKPLAMQLRAPCLAKAPGRRVRSERACRLCRSVAAGRHFPFLNVGAHSPNGATESQVCPRNLLDVEGCCLSS